MSPQEKQGKNLHITDYLDKLKIPYEKMYKPRHLKQGDYTFEIDGVDYRDLFLIERKYGLDELYMCLIQSNIKTKAKTKRQSICDEMGVDAIRDNLEFEFIRMYEIGVKEKWLFVENSLPFDEIKKHTNGFERKAQTAGEYIHATLSSWSCSNRYDFKILCFPNKNNFGKYMLNKMYYFWRNEMKIQYGADFLSKLKLKNKM